MKALAVLAEAAHIFIPTMLILTAMLLAGLFVITLSFFIKKRAEEKLNQNRVKRAELLGNAGKMLAFIAICVYLFKVISLN